MRTLLMLALSLFVSASLVAQAGNPGATPPQTSEHSKDQSELAPTASAGGNTKAVQVAPRVSQGLLFHKVAPVYPESARQNHVEGTVVLRAVIDKSGRVVELKPVSGPKELVAAAMGAVQQWRYKPYILEGQPAAVATQITVNFQLH